MAAVQVAALCVAGALLCAALRAQKPEMAMVCALATGLAALMGCLDGLSGAVQAVRTLSGRSGLPEDSTQVLIRATGVALLSDFAAQLCRDAGESALAGRVELTGRVTLLTLAAPLLIGLTAQLTSLLPAG